MRLCENCLNAGDDVDEYPVGNVKGSQRDPYYTVRLLCALCSNAIESGDWKALNERYTEQRMIKR